MPAKYAHTKKRTSSTPRKFGSDGRSRSQPKPKDHRNPNPHNDRQLEQTISETKAAVSQLERTIARILLLRFEQDMARLFSTHLYYIALLRLPTFVIRCSMVGGSSWLAANSDCEEVKDFFRATISMDLRQAGERVATKSVLWSYTALRHFVRPSRLTIPQTTRQ